MTNLDALLKPAYKKATPKILTLDIETSPHLAYTFSTWNTNINPDMIVETSRVLCVAAKWLHQDKVLFYSEWKDGREGMLQKVRDLIDQADVLVTYNGPGFDEKHLAREFLLTGIPAPAPFKSVDLLKVVRANFKFPSNRLGQVGQELSIGNKEETGGWQLWYGVLHGDLKAQRHMAKYNKQDVVLTEQLFYSLLPYVKGLPHAGLLTGNTSACCKCASTELEPHGVTYTNTAVYPLFSCSNCGAWNKVLRNGQTRSAA